MYPSSHDTSLRDPSGWYPDTHSSWYAGSRGGRGADNWSDLSFSPSPEYDASRENGWWKPGNLPLEKEPGPANDLSARQTSAMLSDRDPVDGLLIRQVSDPDNDRCLSTHHHPEYQKIMERLDTLLQAPSEQSADCDCDCSWSEFLSEKWKDLLIMSLVVFVLVVILIWVLRRRHRPARRDY